MNNDIAFQCLHGHDTQYNLFELLCSSNYDTNLGIITCTRSGEAVGNSVEGRATPMTLMQG